MSEEGAVHFSLAEEKLAAARELLAQDFLRDAASRAYYAMYHAAYALVRTRGHAPKTHAGLALLVSKEFAAEQHLGRDLVDGFRRAQSARALSDYEAVPPPTETEVERILADAEAFVHRARDLVR